MIFYFAIICPWGRVWAFIWIILNPLNPRMLCVNFVWNWPSRRSWPFTCKNVNPWWFVPRLVEIGPVVLEKEIFEYFLKNFTFLLLSPLEKGLGPSFETWILNPFAQRRFLQSLVEISGVVLMKMKMWNVYRQKDRQTNGRTTQNRQSEKIKKNIQMFVWKT